MLRFSLAVRPAGPEGQSPIRKPWLGATSPRFACRWPRMALGAGLRTAVLPLLKAWHG